MLCIRSIQCSHCADTAHAARKYRRLRALLIRTDACSDFETTSEIPINRACLSATVSPNALYMISGTAGINRLRIRAASKPFITGMARSSTIQSGCNSCAFAIASFPFYASPHTSKSASRLNSSESPRRGNRLSSTINTDFVAAGREVPPQTKAHFTVKR